TAGDEDIRGDHRVATRAVGRERFTNPHIDFKVTAQGLILMIGRFREERARKPQRAEGLDRYTGPDEGKVEARAVRDNEPSAAETSHALEREAQTRRSSDHPIGDAVNRRRLGRDGTAGIDQRAP